jgi:hypothetical protein
MVKTKSLKENLSSYPLNILINKFKRVSKFPETESNIIPMSNQRNIPSIKKSMSMNPMFKKKNWSLFSEEFRKKPMLLKNQ